MAPKPQRKSLGIEVPPADLPPGIAALFVIRFDIKAGYVISWKRSLPDVDVEGVVEYKSLPSGLHNVSEDLVYFVHNHYAGVSTFLNRPAAESERNATMFSIGALVPINLGRLGKSWRHARRIKELAQAYAQDMSNTQLLSNYWDMHQIRGPEPFEGTPDSPLDSPIGVSKPPSERPDIARHGRVFSDAMLLESSRPPLAPFHPASSLADFVDAFGPLIFPLYRAALLRKRVLLVTEAPVHLPCNYVYDLSLLASVPNSLAPLLPSGDSPARRPRPLFNVGVHDIPWLSSLVDKNPAPGQDRNWIACTTDSVLSMKSDLYDVLVTLPPSYSKNATEKRYPQISLLHLPRAQTKRKSPVETHLKATQRDVRRYTTLRKGLRQVSRNDDFQPSRSSSNTNDDNNDDGDDDEDFETASTFSSTSIVEPLSWTRRAYTSFIWWASAGEKREGLSEEEEDQEEQDTRLLVSMDSIPNDPIQSVEPPEVALVAYFRRLTTQIFVALSDAIARYDGNDFDNDPILDLDGSAENAEGDDINDDINEASASTARQSPRARDGYEDDNDPNAPLLHGASSASRPTNRRRRHHQHRRHCWNSNNDDNDSGVVAVTPADMAAMGLDSWSEADRVFVQELALLWWGREVVVNGARITCCGIPIL